MKIKCIGFSVTGYGDPSYSVALSDLFKENGTDVNVSYSSVGGLSIDALPYMLPFMVHEGEADLVVLEITTSWFSLVRKNIQEAIYYIQLILGYFENIETNIIFLNLYRKDIDDFDIVRQAIDQLAHDNYTIIDMKAQYRNRAIEVGDGTNDGVHPNAETINQIARILHHTISSKSFVSKNIVRDFDVGMLSLVTPANLDYSFDSRHGLIIKSKILIANEEINFEFNDEQKITGIFYLMGPDSSSVSLHLNEEEVTVPMYDEMSFYRRIGYRYLGTRLVKKIKLVSLADRSDVKLVRDPWEKVETIKNYIIGFSCGG